jgi:hypothetical protein
VVPVLGAALGHRNPPHRKAEVAGIEITLFQMLKRSGGVVFVMAGKVNLAIFADDPAGWIDQNGRIEALSSA